MADTAQPVIVMGLMDEDYQRIARMARKSRIGVRLQDKVGPVRFYYKAGQLFADRRDASNNITTQPCVNVKDVLEQQGRANATAATEGTQNDLFKNAVLPKIREDHPDWTEEEVDAVADIMNEANGSMKRLILTGVDEQLAARLVAEALIGTRQILGKPRSDPGTPV